MENDTKKDFSFIKTNYKFIGEAKLLTSIKNNYFYDKIFEYYLLFIQHDKKLSHTDACNDLLLPMTDRLWSIIDLLSIGNIPLTKVDLKDLRCPDYFHYWLDNYPDKYTYACVDTISTKERNIIKRFTNNLDKYGYGSIEDYMFKNGNLYNPFAIKPEMRFINKNIIKGSMWNTNILPLNVFIHLSREYPDIQINVSFTDFSTELLSRYKFSHGQQESLIQQIPFDELL